MSLECSNYESVVKNIEKYSIWNKGNKDEWRKEIRQIFLILCAAKCCGKCPAKHPPSQYSPNQDKNIDN